MHIKKYKQTKLLRRIFGLYLAVFIILTITISYIVHQVVHEALYIEYKSKAEAISESLKNTSAIALSENEYTSVQSQIDSFKKIKGVEYIVVRNHEKEIIAHTFYPKIDNNVEKKEEESLEKKQYTIERIKLNNKKNIIEIISPILEGEIGFIHIGMSLSPIEAVSKEILKKEVFIITTLLILSLIFLIVMFIKIIYTFKMLLTYTHRLSKHDFKTNLPLEKTLDEIKKDPTHEVGILVREFTSLENKIKTYIEDLETATKEKARIENELSIAKEIQESLLPEDKIIENNTFELTGYLHPAKEVGGDFLYYSLINQKLWVIVADVSGKGIGPALFMAQSITLIKAALEYKKSPSEVLKVVNQQLCFGNKNSLFVTAFIGVLNIENGQLTYSNAGHPNPIKTSSKGIVEEIETTKGIPLGLLENTEFEEKTLSLSTNDGLVMFTDGIDEAESKTQELFGIERIKKTLAKTINHKTIDVQNTLLTEIKEHTKGAVQNDDITLLIIKYKG